MRSFLFLVAVVLLPTSGQAQGKYFGPGYGYRPYHGWYVPSYGTANFRTRGVGSFGVASFGSSVLVQPTTGVSSFGVTNFGVVPAGVSSFSVSPFSVNSFSNLESRPLNWGITSSVGTFGMVGTPLVATQPVFSMARNRNINSFSSFSPFIFDSRELVASQFGVTGLGFSGQSVNSAGELSVKAANASRADTADVAQVSKLILQDDATKKEINDALAILQRKVDNLKTVNCAK